jgi:hypothetical protein
MQNIRSMVVKGVLAAIFLIIVGCNQQPRLVVLIPDDALETNPAIAVWADAAWEEGIKLSFLTDSQFLALGDTALTQYPGIILPDETHAKASAALIAALGSYASAGGWLMLVYDFGALDENGFYPATGPSRMSSLAGINYVLYDILLDRTIGLGPIAGANTVLRELQVPPGKSMAIVAAASTTPVAATINAPAGEQALAAQISATTAVTTAAADSGTYLPSSAADPGGLNGYAHAAQFDAVGSESGTVTTTATLSSLASLQATLAAAAATEVQEQISGYVYGPLTYPAYVTADSSGYNGTVLLGSTYGYDASTSSMTTAGVAAGWRNQGTGGVVFVNTPLSYLNGETDGMLMHGFLRFFAASVLKMPRLSDHPDGRGGLVFNWHVDAAEALAPMTTLETAGVWAKGPFSIHFTAGPDTLSVGDGLGLNVPGNTVSQGWITKFASLNHQVGDHGGWDHDLFGLNATEYNADVLVPGQTQTAYTFIDFLSLNKQAMEAVWGRPVTEYSAPEGNCPIWSLNWLEANGNVGYYFTGHTGLGPTRAYRPTLENPAVAQMFNPTMWAFPVTPFGKYATFEEFQEYAVPNADVSNWYTELVNFVVKNRTSRLIYAHPPGAAGYLDVLSSLFSLTDSLSATNQFRWYTMTDLAKFEARRLQLWWNEGKLENFRFFGATHPTDLSGFSWILPKSVYGLPGVISGMAEVDQSDSDNWIVTAKGGTYLSFYSTRSQ